MGRASMDPTITTMERNTVSTPPVPPAPGAPQMSDYEAKRWRELNAHWDGRANPHGLPKWLRETGGHAVAASRDAYGRGREAIPQRVKDPIAHAGQATRAAAQRAGAAVPETVKEPVRRAGEIAVDGALMPSIHAAVRLLELVNDWVVELNDPKYVERIARKRGLELDSFTELRQQDMKVCDRLLSRHTLGWRTAGALEGGAMGVLATVTAYGAPLAVAADVAVIQLVSVSIAARVAYSYGFDAKDPDERVFIQRIVTRSFIGQAARVGPMREAAQSWHAIKGRVRWSDKLRQDNRLIAELETLMQRWSATGKVPVKDVGKVIPFVNVLLGAGMNSTILGNVSADAQRYCQTRFLAEKYNLALPDALLRDEPAEVEDQVPPAGPAGDEGELAPVVGEVQPASSSTPPPSLLGPHAPKI